MSEEELIETLRAFEKNRVEQLEEPARNLFYAIMKVCDERDRLNNIINELKKYIEDTKQDGYKLVWINEYKNYFEAGIEEILGVDKE